MAEHAVASTDEIDEGERVVAVLEGREVAVFNVDGEYHAYLNWCLHQSGPVCEGPISGTAEATFDRESLTTDVSWGREGTIINCPWHGWEFDLTTGECLSRAGAELPSFPVEVRDGEVVVTL